MIKTALITPAAEGGWQLLVEYEGGRSDRYHWATRIECVNFLTALMPDPDRLPCGCLKECDSRAHDTAPDWDGRPDVEDGRVYCADCGTLCEQKDADDEGEYICSACAIEYAAAEREVQRALECEDDSREH